MKRKTIAVLKTVPSVDGGISYGNYTVLQQWPALNKRQQRSARKRKKFKPKVR